MLRKSETLKAAGHSQGVCRPSGVAKVPSKMFSTYKFDYSLETDLNQIKKLYSLS